jgi:signal peptidase I
MGMSNTKAKQREEEQVDRSVGWVLWNEYVLPIGLALLAALFIRTVFLEAFRIPSGSMVPTLAIGDHIFVNKLSYRLEIPYRIFKVRLPMGGTTLIRWGEPTRGDVAVFRYPRDPMVDFVKRIVAVPGDTVEVRNGTVFINGMAQAQEAAFPRRYRDRFCREHIASVATETNLDGRSLSVQSLPGTQQLENVRAVVVPEDHYFAMGDNRDNSEDSRAWGFVPYDHLKGRAMVVWLSWDKCAKGLERLRFGRFFHRVHRLIEEGE